MRIAPDLAISYIRLGSIYYKVNDFKNAKLNWRKGYDLDPENPLLVPIKEFILSP